MARYIAFDVETPNRLNHRMSAIGIAVAEDGAIVEEFYSLVDPETDFDPFNTWLTGISEESVKDAPTFPELWPKIEGLLSGGVLVAHNATFDLGVLRRCLDDYDIAWKKSVPYLCTVQMGRRILPGISHKLDAMSQYFGIELDHHHAGSDSRACAEILLRYLRMGAEEKDYLRWYSMLPKRK